MPVSPKPDQTNNQGSRQFRLVSFPLFAYAPQFVALGIHAFEAEHLDVTLVHHTGSWSGLIDLIGQGATDVVVGNMWFAMQQSHHPNVLLPIASCLQQCGTLLVERSDKSEHRFEWKLLEARTVVVQSDVPTPWIAMRECMSLSGVSLDSVKVVVGLNTAEAIDALTANMADYAALHIDRVQTNTIREVVALADVLGRVPWSVFLASKAKVELDPEPYRRFQRAIGVAMRWISNHHSREVAELITAWFPHVSMDTATNILERYRILQGWPTEPTVELRDVARWQAVLVRWGLMPNSTPLDDLLSFAGSSDA
jgi:NitT/TauT family transport system substrate-binding protein